MEFKYEIGEEVFYKEKLHIIKDATHFGKSVNLYDFGEFVVSESWLTSKREIIREML